MTPAFAHSKICPLVTEQRPECFCTSLTSQKIIQTLDYCCDRFIECTIFLRHRPEGRSEENPSSAHPAAEGEGAEI